MPTFTDMQKSLIRHYMGYTVGYSNVWTMLEGGMANIEQNSPSDFLLLTNLITDSPPGILAQLQQIEVDMFGARSRYKASAVGPIRLNPGENQALANNGRRLAGKLAQIIGCEILRDVFSGGNTGTTAREGWPSIGMPGGSYRGKV